MPSTVAQLTARAWIHRGHQHEIRREGQRPLGPADRDHLVLDGLAKDLQDCVAELGQLVQEQDSTMTQRDLLEDLLFTKVSLKDANSFPFRPFFLGRRGRGRGSLSLPRGDVQDNRSQGEEYR